MNESKIKVNKEVSEQSVSVNRENISFGGAVSSVNGQTGDVVLTAQDVNALPDDTVIPAELTAGDNITIEDNVISATDTTYTHFTGATSEADGTAGLVPAPTTADVEKFLKGDGTWGAAGGGGLPTYEHTTGSQIAFWDAWQSLNYPAAFIVKNTTASNVTFTTATGTPWGNNNPAVYANSQCLIIAQTLTAPVAYSSITASNRNKFQFFFFSGNPQVYNGNSYGVVTVAHFASSNRLTGIATSLNQLDVFNTLPSPDSGYEYWGMLSYRSGMALRSLFYGRATNASASSVLPWVSIGTGSSYTKRSLMVTINLAETGLTTTADTWTSTGITLPNNFIPSQVVYGSVTVDNGGAYETGVVRINTSGVVEVKSSIGATNVTGQVIFPVAS